MNRLWESRSSCLTNTESLNFCQHHLLSELIIPPTGNVFYAMSSSSVDFLLRSKGGNSPFCSPSISPETSATFPRIKAKGRRLVRNLFWRKLHPQPQIVFHWTHKSAKNTKNKGFDGVLSRRSWTICTTISQWEAGAGFHIPVRFAFQIPDRRGAWSFPRGSKALLYADESCFVYISICL